MIEWVAEVGIGTTFVLHLLRYLAGQDHVLGQSLLVLADSAVFVATPHEPGRDTASHDHSSRLRCRTTDIEWDIPSYFGVL